MTLQLFKNMQTMNMLSIIALLSLIAIGTDQKCFIINEDRLQTGFADVVKNENLGETSYQVQLNYIPFPDPIYIALASDYIELYSPDFNITASYISTSNSIQIKVFSQKSWQLIRVSYLASSRSDIKAGSFNHFVLSKDISLSSPFGSTQNYEVAIFINGLIGWSDSSIEFRLSQPSYNNGQITFSMESQAQILQISYVLWKPVSQFTIQLFNQHLIIQGVYQIYGKFDQEKYKTLSIDTKRIRCQGKSCRATCLNPALCTEMEASVFNQTCFACTQQQVVQNGACHCKLGYALNQATGNCFSYCQRDNQTWVSHKRECFCYQGYSRVSGFCQKCQENEQCDLQCGENEIVSDKECSCKPGYFINSFSYCQEICLTHQVWNGTSCICEEGYGMYDEICRICPQKSTAINSKCVCDEENYIFNQVNGFCSLNEICSLNQFFNGQKCVCRTGYTQENSICVLKCEVNQVSNGTSCICQSGFVKHGNVCKRCPEGSYEVNRNCFCDSGQPFNQTNFSCASICQTNQMLSDRGCICKNGFIKNPSSGFCQLRCDTVTEYYNGIKCNCYAGFGRYDDSCRKCPIGSRSSNEKCVCYNEEQIFNSSTFLCVAGCGLNEILVNQNCVCKDGYTRNDNEVCQKQCPANEILIGGQCVCSSGSVRYQKTCRLCPDQAQVINGNCRCPSNQIFIELTNSCETTCGQNRILQGENCSCEPGYALMGDQCISKCFTNQIWNGIQCVCLEGFFKYIGECRRCPEESYQQNGDCVCPDNSRFDKSTASCQHQCGSNKIFNGLDCVCKPGFINFVNICQSMCGINQVFGDDNKCACKEGYVKYRGACRECPDQAQIINSTCVCPQNREFNQIKGICGIKCKDYQVLSGDNCVCPYGLTRNHLDICQQNPCQQFEQRLSLNGRCACIPGYARISGTCQLCPDNLIAVNEVCQCSGPYREVFNLITLKCESICGTNKVFLNQKCQCISGYQYNTNQQCQQIKCKIFQEKINGQCTCTSGYARLSGACQLCPGNLPASNEKCICPQSQNFNEQTYTCDSICQQNQQLVDQICSCKFGYYFSSDGCRSICRQGFVYDQSRNCIPDDRTDPENHNCPDNSFLNQQTQLCECFLSGQYLIDGVCKGCNLNEVYNGSQCVCDSNYYKINGVCSTCDANSQYNNGTCVCNSGYYGNLNQCFKCWQTCGTCSGPTSGQCISCSEPTDILQRGICIRILPILPYQEITAAGAVHLYGRIVQGIRLSSIPPQLTQNNCANCSQLLWVKLIASRFIPTIKINYVSDSKYHFLIEFQFSLFVAIPVFQISIQINPDSMSQSLTIKIDPAILNPAYKEMKTVSMESMFFPNKIFVPKRALEEIFSK